MKPLLCSIFLLISTVSVTAESFFPVFTPPEGWLIADPESYEKGVQVGFVESTKKFFSPSLSLTIEKIGNVSLETYLEAVKKHYASDRSSTCSQLGHVSTAIGNAPLLQIDMKNQWGQIRVLQAIAVYEGYALIQTAATLKKDFLRVHEAILKAFQTLCVYPSLYSSINNLEFQKKTESLFANWKTYRSTSTDSAESLFTAPSFQEKEWKPFTHYVEKVLKFQGACWQFLALKHIQESLMEHAK